MKTLTDYEILKSKIETKIEDLKQKHNEVNNFIANLLKFNTQKKELFIKDFNYSIFNADNYGNKSNKSDICFTSEIFLDVLKENPLLEQQLLMKYRSVLLSKIRFFELELDSIKQKALLILNP